MSSDTLLGLPFNVIGYCSIFHLFAKYCGLNIGSFTIDSTNTHVYEHHWSALDKQREQFEELVAEVRSTGNPMQYPIMRIDPKIFSLEPKELLDSISVEMFNLEGYNPKGKITGRVTK